MSKAKRENSKVAEILSKQPGKEAEINILADKMDLTEYEARGCIDQSRYKGYKIENSDRRMFKLED